MIKQLCISLLYTPFNMSKVRGQQSVLASHQQIVSGHGYEEHIGQPKLNHLIKRSSVKSGTQPTF